MADFSFLSDGSSDEGAVEELLSQAMDHCVLEQVAAINCSSFTSDSVLPTHLETRFRRLKSLPAAKSNSPSLFTDSRNSSASFNSHFTPVKSLNPQVKTPGEGKSETHSLSDDENAFSKEDPKEIKGLKPKLGSGSGSSPAKSPNSSAGNAIFSPLKENPDRKLGSCKKSRSGSFIDPSYSSDLPMESPSPPKKACCFWCSPKRVSTKKSMENQVIGVGGGWERNSEEFLSDLSVFSTKTQEKLLKRAIKEEEKINREAEKIVKWAKQASARMDISDIEDEISDSEIRK